MSGRTYRGPDECVHSDHRQQMVMRVFRKMLLILALQWRLAAREEAAMQSTQPKRSYIVAEGCDYIKPATAV